MTDTSPSCGSGFVGIAGKPFETLEQAMAWCMEVQATVRFYAETQGHRLRVAVHSDPRDIERIAVAVLAYEGTDSATLTATLETARQEIEPQIRRRQFRLVASAEPN